MSFSDNFYKELEKQKKKKKKTDNDIAPVSTGSSFSDNFYAELQKREQDIDSLDLNRTYGGASFTWQDDIAPLPDTSVKNTNESDLDKINKRIADIEDQLGYNDNIFEQIGNAFSGDDPSNWAKGWIDEIIGGGKGYRAYLKDELAELKAKRDGTQVEGGDGWLKSGMFSDGYQVGDAVGSVIGTAGHAVGEIGKGIGSGFEGITDLILSGLGEGAELVGADSAGQYLKDSADHDTVNWLVDSVLGDGFEDASFIGEKGEMLPQAVGYIKGLGWVGKLGNLAGLGKKGIDALVTAYNFLSSTGSSVSEARNHEKQYATYVNDSIKELDTLLGEGKITKEDYDQYKTELEKMLESNSVSDREAWAYGVLNGSIQAGSEMLFGGLGKSVNALGVSRGISSLDDQFATLVTKKLTNHVVRNIAQGTIKAGGESLEEVLAAYGSAWAKHMTYMSDEELSKLVEDENVLEQAIIGFLASGISQTGDVASSIKNKTDFVTGLTTNEQTVADKVFEERLAEESKNRKINNIEKNKLYDQVVEEMKTGRIDTDTLERILGGETYEGYKNLTEQETSLTDRKKAIEKEISSLVKTPESQFTVEQRETLNSLREEAKGIKAQIKGLDTKTAKSNLFNEVNKLTANDTFLRESYRQREKRGEAFTADLNKYKGKQREAVKRAIDSGVLNDTYRSHELVDILSRLEAEKGIVFDYTNNEKLLMSGMAIKGKTINGFEKDGVVTLNVQSSKAWQSTVGHEITHVLEGTEAYSALQEALIQYSQSKGDYQSRYDSLVELYKGVKGYETDFEAKIKKELTADLVGDYLFSDKAFIDRLVGNRTLFQKVWDEVKYLCKVATGKELTEIEKVNREFERAWKELGQDAKEESYNEEEAFGDPAVNFSVSVTDKATLDSLNDQIAKGEYDAETNPDGGYYAAPVEIVPDSEVAQAYKSYLEGTDVAIPDNVVSPNLLSELKKAGVPIEESGKVSYSLSEGSPIINTLTNEEISEQTYDVLGRLERGENVPLSELAALKEVKEGIQQRDSLTNRFVANHPELKDIPYEEVGTHLIQTEERERVREAILDKRLKEGSFTGIDKNGKEVYNGSVEKGKRLDIVIGIPAAGKSSAIVNPISQYYKSMVIDSDIIKGELPEYNGGWGASLVHEESKDINIELFDRATQTGNNIVLPIVGHKASSVEEYLLIAKAQGYEVYLHLNELPSGKAMGRVLNRYFNKGRFIEPAIAGKYGNKPTEVYEEMKARGDLSGYSRWNNDVARGQRPVFRDGSESLEAFRKFSEAWRATRTSETDGDIGPSSQGTDAYLGDGVGGPQGLVGAISPRGEISEGNIGLPKFVRLNPKTQEALSQSGVVSLELIDSSSDSNAFSHALSEARTSDEKNGWAVTPKSAEELVENNIRTIMTSDGNAGLGVAPDGDIEAVFKNQKGGQPGVLKTLIPAALEMGGNKLDCYGDGLVKLYARYGFVPVARLTFNPEYANDGWTPDKGMPDIFFMVHNGDSADTVAANIGKYKAWTTEELNALPLFDKDAYDDAYAYRDSLLPEDIAPIPDDQYSLSNKGDKFTPTGNYSTPLSETALEGDIAPVQETVEKVQESAKSPTENVQETFPEAEQVNAPIVETLIEDDIAKLQEEYKQKRATLEEETKDKDAFVRKRAMELYNELSHLKKGVRASKELGYLLDYGYPWSEIKSTLLKVKLSPDQVINPDSVVESLVRETVNAEYEDKVYELDDIDNDYKEQEAKLRAQALKDNGQSEAVLEKVAAKLKNLKTELDNNLRLREESNADFDSEIARLQAEYEAKKNKNTKVANDILRRIERIQRLKGNVDADYQKRITGLQERIQKTNTPQYKRGEQRRAKQEKWSNEIKAMIGDTSTWIDKKLGISYQTNTLHRNLRDVVRDAKGNRDIAKADAIYEYLQGSYNHNEALLKRESRDIKQPFADMKINKYESEYIQMLGEFKYNPDTKLTQKVVDEYYGKHKNNINLDKVNGAIEESRKVYDDLFKRVNAVLRDMGLKEIGYKEGYFPHFTDTKQSWLAKLFNWKTIDTEIPTDIAGITEEFNPVRTYQSFDKHRKSDETDYNFLKGFDTYVHGALDWIYHIEDIQKRRAFENEIRYSHSEKGIQDKVTEIKNNKDLDADEVQALLDNVYTEAKNPLNNFVTDLRNSTNNLAGKKSTADRSMEYATNRKVYSTMTNISNRVSANMVVGSISSALTNFIPITQSWGQVSPVSSLRAVGDVVRNAIHSDGMIEKSDFMTNRLMDEENLNQTGWDKASNVAGGLMNIFDHFTTEVVWRSKFSENMSNGMSESEAIHDADIFAENVMAGRSRGNMPTIYNSKNPITKILTAFQLEVGNQYGYMFKDLPQDVGKDNIRKLTAGYAKMFIGAYVYNALFSKLTGRDAAFDPIGILEDLLKDLGFGDDDEEEEVDILGAVQGFGENIVQEIPYVGGLLGGGRIPISSALPYDSITEMVTGTMTDIADKDWENLTNEWLNPVYYLALPFGGGQIKKTNEGLAMFSDDHPVSGSYTASGNLRFPVEDTPLNRAQAALFGQYASENAREYFDEGYAPLKEKQIQEYIDVDIPIKDYWEYREGLNDLAPLPGKSSVTLEQKVDYINSLDLPVSKKNILVNNITDRKDPIDMTDYGDYSSLEEFDFANKYPDKYAVAKSVGGYSSYKNYASALSDIKADKDANGKTITGSRKEKVIQYINGLNADYTTKIILYKAEYPSDDTYNADIINYVNNRADLTYDERVAILTELGFRVVNGNIYAD
jgi:hypothetical protein